MSAYSQLKKDTLGKYLTVTGADARQCTATFHYYTNLLKTPIVWGNAVDLYTNASTAYWTKIPNTPSAVPKQGDVIIWGAMPGNPYGHVGIFDNGNVNSFTSLDQNWPTGSVVHLQKHANYAYVKGWLRYKAPAAKPTAPAKATKAQADALYVELLGRHIDEPAIKLRTSQTVDEIRTALLASAERQAYLARKAKEEAAKVAAQKAAAIAEAKAKAAAEQAKIDAAKKADAEAAAKAAEALKDMPNVVAENNRLLNKLVELVTQILNKIMEIFK